MSTTPENVARKMKGEQLLAELNACYNAVDAAADAYNQDQENTAAACLLYDAYYALVMARHYWLQFTRQPTSTSNDCDFNCPEIVAPNTPVLQKILPRAMDACGVKVERNGKLYIDRPTMGSARRRLVFEKEDGADGWVNVE